MRVGRADGSKAMGLLRHTEGVGMGVVAVPTAACNSWQAASKNTILSHATSQTIPSQAVSKTIHRQAASRPVPCKCSRRCRLTVPDSSWLKACTSSARGTCSVALSWIHAFKSSRMPVYNRRKKSAISTGSDVTFKLGDCSGTGVDVDPGPAVASRGEV